MFFFCQIIVFFLTEKTSFFKLFAHVIGVAYILLSNKTLHGSTTKTLQLISKKITTEKRDTITSYDTFNGPAAKLIKINL